MKVYVIHPNLCDNITNTIMEFYNVMVEELESYLDVIRVRSSSSLLNTDFSSSDCVILFNNKDREYRAKVKSFINEAKSNIESTKFFPIASDKESRVPCDILNESQSYDFVEKLAVRQLTEKHINVVALDFARYVIASMQPTLANNEMNIFISHRRIDGEETARDIFKRLQERSMQPYRDLIKVHAGQEAQENIERNLALSDFVLFLDTPEAGKSEWILKELKLAIEQNIPILWVKDGSNDNREELSLKPFDRPHIISDVDSMDDEEFNLLIERIIKEGHRLIREQSEKALYYLAELNKLSNENFIDFEWHNRNHMVATVKIPRSFSRYHERPLEHRIQIFGRNIKKDDKDIFEKNFCKKDIDSSVLLTPFKSSFQKVHEELVVDSLDDYIIYLEQVLSSREMKSKAIVLSGAFPDCEPEFQSIIYNALKSISETVFSGGYKLIFGAHPSFKHLIIQSKNMYASRDKTSLKMYVSKYFVTNGLIAEDEKIMTVVPTESKSTICDSLTIMREAMINDENVVAMIVLGGKTSAGGHIPGVDEEISLAQKRGVPVFLIGSVGGRSSELAEECINTGSFDSYNDFGYQFNESIAKETSFKSATRKILKKL